MWTVVYMAPNRTGAEMIKGILTPEGLLVMLRPAGVPQFGDGGTLRSWFRSPRRNWRTKSWVRTESDYMPLKDLFRKSQRYITVRSSDVAQERGTLWIKCPACGEILYARELEKNLNICRKCSHHFRLTAPDGLAITLDEDQLSGIGR